MNVPTCWEPKLSKLISPSKTKSLCLLLPGHSRNGTTGETPSPPTVLPQAELVVQNNTDHNGNGASEGPGTDAGDHSLARLIQENCEIEKSNPQGGVILEDYKIARLVEAFFSKMTIDSRRAYAYGLNCFGRFLGLSSPSDVAYELFKSGVTHANFLILEYATHLKTKKLASSTIRLQLQAVRSLVKFANMIGIVNWTITVDAAPSCRPLRDTRGPGIDGVRKLYEEAAKQPGPKGLRDKAMIRLMWDLGLRRCEINRLDVEDVNLDEGYIMVLGKMRTEKERLTLPWGCLKDLRAWIGDRRSGPLFTATQRPYEGKRLNRSTIDSIIHNLGKRCGIKVWPHGIRHAAITDGLDATDGNMRDVQKFSRHKSMNMLLIYDDNRQDKAGEIASLISARLTLLPPSSPPAPG